MLLAQGVDGAALSDEVLWSKRRITELGVGKRRHQKDFRALVMNARKNGVERASLPLDSEAAKRAEAEALAAAARACAVAEAPVAGGGATAARSGARFVTIVSRRPMLCKQFDIR